jgi:CheY-like chemotaxis protein
VSAGEATEALQILKQAPVDLVLLDFKLPEMQGTKVIAKA